MGRQPGSEIWGKEENSDLELQSEKRNCERQTGKKRTRKPLIEQSAAWKK